MEARGWENRPQFRLQKERKQKREREIGLWKIMLGRSYGDKLFTWDPLWNKIKAVLPFLSTGESLEECDPLDEAIPEIKRWAAPVFASGLVLIIIWHSIFFCAPCWPKVVHHNVSMAGFGALLI